MDRMGDGTIQPVVQPVTVDIMLNNKGLNNGHVIQNVTCEQGLTFKERRNN